MTRRLLIGALLVAAGACGDDAGEQGELTGPAAGRIEGNLTTLSVVGGETSVDPLNAARLVLRRGGETVVDTEGNRSYFFGGLEPGRYTLRVESEGARDSLTVDVVGDLVTTVHAFRMSLGAHAGIVVHRPALLRAPEDPNPDVVADSIIDAADLDFVSECVGADPADCDGDVDGDGVVDEADVRSVERDFGFTVVTLPLELRVPVVDAGITAAVAEPGAEPAATGASLEGEPIVLTAEVGGSGALRLASPTYSGSAVSPEVGDLTFSGGDAGGVELSFDATTGELVGGGVTIAIAGQEIDDLPPLSLSARSGQLVFARGDLRLLVVAASRVLPADFPLFAGLELRLLASGAKE